jgi:hypothetical protein
MSRSKTRLQIGKTAVAWGLTFAHLVHWWAKIEGQITHTRSNAVQRFRLLGPMSESS